MIEIRDGMVVLDVKECIYCGSKNIIKLKDIIICLDCGESFVDTYEFENPRDCNHCGYFGDCLERFKYCPFDGKNVNEKLIESWKKELL